MLRRIVVFLVLIISFGVGIDAQADQPHSAADIQRAWRARQARVETLDCSVDSLMHYAKESRHVSGQALPPRGQACKQQVSLQLKGPAKFRIRHQGQQWHDNFGQVLNADSSRFYDGRQYFVVEKPYAEIPTWRPRPRIYDKPKPVGPAQLRQDIVLYPVLLMTRPQNATLIPFRECEYVVDPELQDIRGQSCIVLRALNAPEGDHVFYVAPDKDMSVVQIELRYRHWSPWQFEIENVQDRDGWRPASYMIKQIGDDRLLDFAKVTVTKFVVNQPIADEVFEFTGDPAAPLTR